MALPPVMRLTFILLLVLAALLSGCIVPGGGPPPTPTPTPTPGLYYTPTQLRYLLLDHYGEDQFFYCDPDYYPVGRGDEAERAVTIFPGIQNETDVFSAIITRKGLQPPYSNETKLVIYREYKKLRAIPLDPSTDGTFTYSLRLGTRGQGRLVSGIIRIDGVILREQSESAVLTCPICLTGDTRIDTPASPVQVKEIRAGMLVWTLDRNGARMVVPVLQVVKKPVPAPFQIVHLSLSDGRELYASAGHPTTDGRSLGILVPGDRLDGALVIRADLQLSSGGFTYDILPAGDTKVYWANGIPLESTLFKK
jgi:hypothetical protein